MGIFCEINLHKPSDGAFVPGSTVSGVIKYAVDKETIFNTITISLKGHGNLILKHKQRRRNGGHHTFRNQENYVDVDNIINPIKCNEAEYALPVGCYETQFSFTLPQNIPASLKYFGHTARYRVNCQIVYYIRIKFESPGLFSFTKRFRKELTVVTNIVPRLPTTPVIHGERKTLTQLFSSKKSVVDVKATVQNSVINPGGKILFTYEVVNDTNIIIKSVETKLIELYNFTSSAGREANKSEDVLGTDSKTISIKSGEAQRMGIEILIPSDRSSLENSKIVSRNYAVSIIVELPMPHRNGVLEIPVQVGNTSEGLAAVGDEAPPSYWEVMGEETKDVEYLDIDDDKE